MSMLTGEEGVMSIKKKNRRILKKIKNKVDELRIY